MESSSSSSSEQHQSCRSIRTSQMLEKSRRRDRRASPPTDSDDEDPFHFDSILSSPPNKKEEGGASRTLSSSLLRRASIVPVDPTAAPAPHRFSLLRERASEETIFVQEICDAEGRRWSLRVPASGLPEDMVHMLEELEKLAVELGQALPKIVVTCSAESLSVKRMERDAVVNSSESELRLRPPPPHHYPIDDENSAECDLSTGRSLAKEKRRLIEPEKVSEELGGGSTEQSSVTVSSTSEQSLTCIYLPEVRATLCYPPQHPHRLMHRLYSSHLSSYREAQLLPSCNPQMASTANQQHRLSNARASVPSSQRSGNPSQQQAALPNV